jgi:hypothetical protein
MKILDFFHPMVASSIAGREGFVVRPNAYAPRPALGWCGMRRAALRDYNIHIVNPRAPLIWRRRLPTGLW